MLHPPQQQKKIAPKPVPPKLRSAGVEQAKVEVSLECRQTEVDVALANGETGTGTATYCNGPNGWYEV